MSTKADYTKEEWDLLVKSPVMAAMAVIAASPNGPMESSRRCSRRAKDCGRERRGRRTR